MTTPEILTAHESCNRRGVWTSQWERHRLLPAEMVRRSISAALTIPTAPNFGEYAGEEVMTLCSDRGIDLQGHNLYDMGLNHAAIADIVTTAIRKPADRPCTALSGNMDGWQSSVLMDPSGTMLRRVLPVSSWSADRHHHEARSWFALGEVCWMKLPMQMIVAVIGQMNGGRRHGYWSRALLHPQHSSVRFKKRTRATIEGFKETWIPIFREEHDEIDRRTWLQGMAEDDVLRESLFVVDVSVPEESVRLKIVDMARRKMDEVGRGALPERQLSTCDSPLSPCPFRGCCWGETETVPDWERGFDRV